MNVPIPNSKIIVVVGDIHSEVPLAVEGLNRIEGEFGAIDQVFSVGDVGLFLEASDWRFLTGPKKHRDPESSSKIAVAWAEWRWPFSMIGGNHEPYQRLRAFDAAHFGGKLAYTNGGVLDHGIPGLQVYGLSGIHHPGHMDFPGADSWKPSRPKSWDDLVNLVATNKAKLQRLTYYKQAEIDKLLTLPKSPDLLLLHDWPLPVPGTDPSEPRPEQLLVDKLSPGWVCSGHRHTHIQTKIGRSHFLALNIIRQRAAGNPHIIAPGWAAVFVWDGRCLTKRASWPALTR
ncbi:MAG: lariat debranching enzyme [Verrucomicrobiota bacterium]|jgi:hypothetical protein